jgi:hypothetical protein
MGPATGLAAGIATERGRARPLALDDPDHEVAAMTHSP